MLEWGKYEHNNKKIEQLNIAKPSCVFSLALCVKESKIVFPHLCGATYGCNRSQSGYIHCSLHVF